MRDDLERQLTRRYFFDECRLGVGKLALAGLLGSEYTFASPPSASARQATVNPLAARAPHYAPKAKRIIYLFQNGAPSQLESFDYKPVLNKRFGEDLPESIRKGQRLTGMTAFQDKFPLVGSKFQFQLYGQAGAWISDLFPHIAGIADDICIIRSMHTEAINLDPALTFMQTGSQQGNRPSMGAWMSYGLGSENENLPALSKSTLRLNLTSLLRSSGGVINPISSLMSINGILP